MAKKDGLIEETDINGKVIKTTEWFEGKKNGWETTFDSEGRFVKRVQYESGNKIVEDEYYKGILSKHTPLSNGKKEGIVIEYQNGVKINEVTYANGKKDGNVFEYFPESGLLKSEKKYENGKRNFHYEKSYYPSGNLRLDKDFDYEIQYLVDNNVPSYKRLLNGVNVLQEDRYFINGKIAWSSVYSPTRSEHYFDLDGNEVDFHTYLNVSNYLNWPKDDIELMKEDPSIFSDNFDGNENSDENCEGEEEDRLTLEYCIAMQNLSEIAKSLDMLGLITMECIKDKLHSAVEEYVVARRKYEDIYGPIECQEDE